MSWHNDFLLRLSSYAEHKCLPQKEDLVELSMKASQILSNEKISYRPHISGLDITGGLVDFSKLKIKPVIVVPDIHARPEFILKLMNMEFDGKPLYKALSEKLLYVVLAGDLMHSESRGRERWLKALDEFENGNVSGPNMEREMKESLGAYLACVECKIRFPECFHILKGNHENIRNSCDNGNYSFRKFVYEGEMVVTYMNEVYGEKIIDAISEVEGLLPVAAVFQQCMVSHAEPKKFYDRVSLQDSPVEPSTIFNMTWTSNGESEEGCVSRMLHEMTKEKKLGFDTSYFTGHRPVSGKYSLRQNGRLIQLHNPREMNVAVVPVDRGFDPETDIVSLK